LREAWGDLKGAGRLGDATWARRAFGTAMGDPGRIGGDMRAAKRPVEATRADDEGQRPGGTRRAREAIRAGREDRGRRTGVREDEGGDDGRKSTGGATRGSMEDRGRHERRVGGLGGTTMRGRIGEITTHRGRTGKAV
jgi:hypothetical protein